MAIDYQTREWKDDQTGGTPIDAANLNRMEQGIANACAGVDGIKGTGGVSADMIADSSISESKLSKDLRDFVSQAPKIIVGEKIITVTGSTRALLFSSKDFYEIAGKQYDNECFVAASNGDSDATEIPIVGIDRTVNSDNINVCFGGVISGSYRVRYVIILA